MVVMCWSRAATSVVQRDSGVIRDTSLRTPEAEMYMFGSPRVHHPSQPSLANRGSLGRPVVNSVANWIYGSSRKHTASTRANKCAGT